jgi:hypothetical protein
MVASERAKGMGKGKAEICEKMRKETLLYPVGPARFETFAESDFTLDRLRSIAHFISSSLGFGVQWCGYRMLDRISYSDGMLRSRVAWDECKQLRSHIVYRLPLLFSDAADSKKTDVAVREA